MTPTEDDLREGMLIARAVIATHGDAEELAKTYLALLAGFQDLKLRAEPFVGPLVPCEVCGAKYGEFCKPGCSEDANEDRAKLRDDLKLAEFMHSALSTLREGIDTSTAKNYATMTFAWDAMLAALPFDRVEVVFIRPGGRTPHEMRKLAEQQLTEAQETVGRLLAENAKLTKVQHG